MIQKLTHDISKEFLIQPYANGIKLIKPDEQWSYDSRIEKITTNAVADILNSPLHVYFYNTDHAFQYLNESTACGHGFISATAGIGKSIQALEKKADINNIIANNNMVLKSNKFKIIEEHLVRRDGLHMQGISIKFPWYDDADNTIGIFGYSVLIDEPTLNSFTNALSLIVKTNLPGLLFAINKSQTLLATSCLDNTHLSRREIQCLQLLSRGKTAKQIAKILTLSYRTVEHYIAHIKKKAGVTSKSELIEKFINKG